MAAFSSAFPFLQFLKNYPRWEGRLKILSFMTDGHQIVCFLCSGNGPVRRHFMAVGEFVR